MWSTYGPLKGRLLLVIAHIVLNVLQLCLSSCITWFRLLVFAWALPSARCMRITRCQGHYGKFTSRWSLYCLKGLSVVIMTGARPFLTLVWMVWHGCPVAFNLELLEATWTQHMHVLCHTSMRSLFMRKVKENLTLWSLSIINKATKSSIASKVPLLRTHQATYIYKKKEPSNKWHCTWQCLILHMMQNKKFRCKIRGIAIIGKQPRHNFTDLGHLLSANVSGQQPQAASRV